MSKVFFRIIFYMLVQATFMPTAILADNNNNGSCDGELISEMNNRTVLTSHTETGTVNRNYDRSDYYYFDINTAGTVDVVYNSSGTWYDNETDFYFSKTGCGNNRILNNGSSVSASMNVNPGDKVYMLVREDNRLTKTYSIALTFTPAGNTPPNIDDQTFSVSESASNGTIVGTVVATDTDGSIQSFGITSGNGSGTFAINNSGILTVADSSQLNVGTYYLTVQVTDNDGATNSATITVNVTSSGGSHEGYRDFTLRKQIKLPGNMVTIGNTLLVPPTTQNSSICSSYTNGPYYSDPGGYNSDYYLCQYHVGGSGTSPATQAVLTLDNPSNSTLEWAGLYWQALVSNSYNVGGMTIKIKNGSSDYQPISYDQLDWGDGTGLSGYISYSAFKDVTALFKQQGWLDGNYTVADIPVIEGKIPTLGTYGAWTLVVIYRNNDENLRGFSVYDGWQKVANESGHTEVPISVAGFYTPKKTPISSKVTVFTAEGDKAIQYDKLWAKPSKKSTETWLTYTSQTNQTFNSSILPNNFSRTPNPINNMGIDIQTFELGTDGYNIIEPEESQITFKFTSNQDTYWPSMIAFNAELYEPDICYDYSYEQLGRYFTEENNGTAAPRIKGNITPNQPITVGIYFRNNEDSDVKASDALLSVDDIGTTSDITYITNSTEVTYAGATAPVSIAPASQGTHSFINLDLGDIDGQEYVYAYYQIDPHGNTEIDIPLSADINYTLNLIDSSGNTIPISYQADLGSGKIPLCLGAGGGTGYEPAYNTFNVEDPNLYSSQKYNLYTQVSGRPWDASIVSYALTNSYNDRNNSAEWVKVELIDAGAYHDAEASCTERDSNITRPVAFYFTSTRDEYGDTTNNISFNSILDAQGIDKVNYYNVAVEEAAYRVWHLVNPYTGEMLQAVCSDQTPMWTFFDEYHDFVVKAGCADLCNAASSACNTPNGNNSGKDLEGCLECLYPYMSKPVCSRDNFAIRPESFVTHLIDDNTTTTRSIALSKNPAYTGETINLAGGYPYRFDINATSHATGVFGDSGVRGYINDFGSYNLSANRAYMSWTPKAINEDTAKDNCNEPVDQNMSFHLQDGTTYNASLTWMSPTHESLTNVGEYAYKVEDSQWTHVDSDSSYLVHHTGGYFLSGTDCIQNSSIVPSTGLSGGADGTNTNPVVGCQISSIHTNADTGDNYVAFNIRVYPYDINVSRIFDLEPTKAFYYMNNVASIGTLTAGLPVDENHSVHLYGAMQAEGKDGTVMTNFVRGCYAEPIVFSYTPSVSSIGGYPLRWRETNSTTDTNSTILPVNIDPGTSVNAFVKDRSGITILDLHINFDRNRTNPVNPIDLNISTISADCGDAASTPYCTTNADGKGDHNATDTSDPFDSYHLFVYGRVHAPRYRLECSGIGSCSTGTTPNQPLILYDEFYYDQTSTIDANTLLSTTIGISSGSLRSVDSINWYVTSLHGASDGNVSAVRQYNGNTPASPSPISVTTPSSVLGGISTIGATYDGSDDYPYKATMGITASPWLIYNRFDTLADHNAFELEFNAEQLGGGTADQSDSNLTNPNTSRRIRW